MGLCSSSVLWAAVVFILETVLHGRITVAGRPITCLPVGLV